MSGNSHMIFIRDLRFHSPVGVLDQERVVGNDIKVDLRLGYPFAKAMESDDVADTLNYAEVYELIRKIVSEPVKLLERLAGKISERLLEEYPNITSIDLSITKLNPPMGADCGGAGVEIHLINPKTGQ